MKKTAAAVAFMIAVVVLGMPAVSSAANKEHQQIMAELRMLQEQQAQLQQILYGLGETLKTITGRLDDQATVTRKAFADQKLLIDNVVETTRILRERADDTNVRLSNIAQELQALRQTIASMPQQTVSPAPAGGETSAVDPAAQPSTPPASGPPPNVSPAQWYDRVFADYAAGQYDFAISGFESFIRAFPTSPQADDAQMYIGNSLFNEGKFKEALQAYQKVITDYPTADTLPTVYYKIGLTYESLQQLDLARKAYETVIKNFPTITQMAAMAQNRLDALNRKR